jgi:hypothetical protein
MVAQSQNLSPARQSQWTMCGRKPPAVFPYHFLQEKYEAQAINALTTDPLVFKHQKTTPGTELGSGQASTRSQELKPVTLTRPSHLEPALGRREKGSPSTYVGFAADTPGILMVCFDRICFAIFLKDCLLSSPHRLYPWFAAQ